MNIVAHKLSLLKDNLATKGKSLSSFLQQEWEPYHLTSYHQQNKTSLINADTSKFHNCMVSSHMPDVRTHTNTLNDFELSHTISMVGEDSMAGLIKHSKWKHKCGYAK